MLQLKGYNKGLMHFTNNYLKHTVVRNANCISLRRDAALTKQFLAVNSPGSMFYLVW